MSLMNDDMNKLLCVKYYLYLINYEKSFNC